MKLLQDKQCVEINKALCMLEKCTGLGSKGEMATRLERIYKAVRDLDEERAYALRELRALRDFERAAKHFVRSAVL